MAWSTDRQPNRGLLGLPPPEEQGRGLREVLSAIQAGEKVSFGEKRAIVILLRELEKIDWQTTWDITDRLVAAMENPGHSNAEPWLHLAGLSPKQLATFYLRLLDPRAVKGRPKGAGSVSSDAETMDEIERLVATGKTATAAARSVLKSKGVKAGIKNRADYLAGLYRQRKERK
jgi:hypothetical protein